MTNAPTPAPASGREPDAPPPARFPIPDASRLDPDQLAFVQGLIAGPRGGGVSGAGAVESMLRRGPFNVWLRSPELGARLQRVGEYVRYGASLATRLSEFAILVTARHWTSQYEWYAHLPIALAAGLDPRVADELARGLEPAGMAEEEAAVHAFCTQLHRCGDVTDETFARVRDLFGERGLVELIGTCGYYTAVSMTLNVGRVPMPRDVPPPLPALPPHPPPAR